MAYQSIGGAKGVSDTEAKLAKIKLPKAMSGQRFLDVGCSAGYFCRVARERGAIEVVGLDHNKESIRLAKEADPEGLYLSGDWYVHLEKLAAENKKFDIIIHLSAFHYVSDQPRLLKLIRSVLSPGGVFVLECGVGPGGHPRYIDHRRSGHNLPYARHLTMPLLESLLDGFAVRKLGRSVDQPGDDIPRFVFHCTPKQPVVLLVSGDSFTGKTILSELLTKNKSVGHVRMDGIVNGLATCPIASIEAAVNAHLTTSKGSVDNIGTTILEHSTPALFGQAVANVLPTCFDTMVVEGEVFSDARLKQALANELISRGFICWDASRMFKNEHFESSAGEGEINLLTDQLADQSVQCIAEKHVRVRPKDKLVMMMPRGFTSQKPTGIAWTIELKSSAKFIAFARVVGKSKPIQFMFQVVEPSEKENPFESTNVRAESEITITSKDPYSRIALDIERPKSGRATVRVIVRVGSSDADADHARAYIAEPHIAAG